MRIPYVIDNGTVKLGDVLSHLLTQRAHHTFDVATAFFNVGAFAVLRDGLQGLKGFRLLLGAEPSQGDDIGVESRDALGQFVEELNAAPLEGQLWSDVEALMAFLRLPTVQVRHQPRRFGFLHAKCYLFYAVRSGQQLLFDRIRPVVGIVGSSNFTRAGLCFNSELNTVHQVLLEPSSALDEEAREAIEWMRDDAASESISPKNQQLLKSEVGARAILDLKSWFDAHWDKGTDFKPGLLRILEESKFGTKEYTPFQVYLKALFEYFRADLQDVPEVAGTRSAVELASFQEDAVHKARRILERYHGVMIADSVGLGKTWIGKKLLEDFAYHRRQQALVVCPASLREMWERTLRASAIAARVVSQESLAQPDFDPTEYARVDVVVVDESHNFRNARSQRYEALDRLLGLNGGQGAAGTRKKVILLTATPINNSVMDLYHQINLIARNDPRYFMAAGVEDLFRYFVAARRESARRSETASLFNLLEEVVVRRTRSFIRDAYPEATIDGKRVHFPERKLRTHRYDLETVFEGLYEDIVDRIAALKLAPYNLDAYRKVGDEADEFALGRGEALVGIFKSRFLKRLESSVAAFRKSVRRALEFQKTFRSYMLDGRLLNSADFRRLLSWLERDDEDDDAPTSRLEEIEASAEARAFLESLPTADLTRYDRKRLTQDVDADVKALQAMWDDISRIGPAHDAKYAMLVDLLAELKGQKVLIFSYYRDTVRYVADRLAADLHDATGVTHLGPRQIARLDSGVATKDRQRLVSRFAPNASQRTATSQNDELDLLVSTDVLSEGHNLQDCGHLINYDLHWNPTRMVQRAGRIDRIGSPHKTLHIHNVFPEEGLERLLGLVQSLSQKIEDINRNGFLDASVLGEAVSPRTFNTLRRIRDEDGSVLLEAEQFAELASPESMLRTLKQFLLAKGAEETLRDLPDGIRSCKAHPDRQGHFYYFQHRVGGEVRAHFWRFVDANGVVEDNRYVIGDLIACSERTRRAKDLSTREELIACQNRAIDDILRTQRRADAAALVPRTMDPVQREFEVFLSQYRSVPSVDRTRVKEAMSLLKDPLPTVLVTELKRLKPTLARTPEAANTLASKLIELAGAFRPGTPTAPPTTPLEAMRREDLYLICFEEILRESQPARREL